MPAKSKWVIVILESVISGHPKIWIRDRAAEKFSGIFFDPQIGREVLFKEQKHLKGKTSMEPRTREVFNILDTTPVKAAVAKK
uniref:Uncharacterized protein n=1 Tax=Plectus sambesii TaxID=2011161 RepID=A0A914VCG5_9BILA